MESIWEVFEGLFKVAHRQGRRIEELENRVTELERRLRDTEPPRPALQLVEPEQPAEVTA